jgi:hypothetical protein
MRYELGHEHYVKPVTCQLICSYDVTSFYCRQGKHKCIIQVKGRPEFTGEFGSLSESKATQYSVYVCQYLEITDPVKTHKISQINHIKISQNSDKKFLIAFEKKLRT